MFFVVFATSFLKKSPLETSEETISRQKIRYITVCPVCMRPTPGIALPVRDSGKLSSRIILHQFHNELLMTKRCKLASYVLLCIDNHCFAKPSDLSSIAACSNTS